MSTEPSAPGWYGYSGGGQTMIFHLDETGQWRVFMDNGFTDLCVWGYIAQALGVWDLVLLAGAP
jgi:hypothetical protein